MFRIAHISDLHVSKVLFSLGQFFSKRWLGNANLILSRKKQFQMTQLWDLVEIFSKEKVDYLFVTGDVTTTSHPDEFALAQKLFNAIKSRGIVTIFTPGNHDVYTKGAQRKKRFYQFCKNPKPYSSFTLSEDRVEIHKLPNQWWYVVCDTSIATSLASSRGYFSETLETNLKEALLSIPSDENIILGTHFPFSQEESKRKILVRGGSLEKILKKHSNIKIFMHGHTHEHRVIPPHGKLPLILDSGSSAHNAIGSWNLLSMTPKNTDIDIFHWTGGIDTKNGLWKVSDKEHFSWSKNTDV